MKVKKFVFPSFEEWVKREQNTEIVVGAYRCEIGVFFWYANSPSKRYMFAVAYENQNPLNVYTSKVFHKIFDYDGDYEQLKKWYNDTIDEFNVFWENHIISNYLEVEVPPEKT